MIGRKGLGMIGHTAYEYLMFMSSACKVFRRTITVQLTDITAGLVASLHGACDLLYKRTPPL